MAKMSRERLPVPKYISHESGFPVRVNAPLRREIAHGSVSALLWAEMVKSDPLIGERSAKDTLVYNLAENIRLRRIARVVSRELVSFAESMGTERYCTVVHGSLARGLVRYPTCNDPSDVDIDLVVDGLAISKAERMQVREKMRSLSCEFGAPLDVYVWDMEDMRRNMGDDARLYLKASAYPIHDRGDLWREIQWIGVEARRFSLLSVKAKRSLRKILRLVSEGNRSVISGLLDSRRIHAQAFSYLEEHDLVSGNGVQQRASELYSFLKIESTSKENANV